MTGVVGTGGPGSGKTCLIERWRRKDFPSRQKPDVRSSADSRPWTARGFLDAA